jgi:hypothetical protein
MTNTENTFNPEYPFTDYPDNEAQYDQMAEHGFNAFHDIPCQCAHCIGSPNCPCKICVEYGTMN